MMGRSHALSGGLAGLLLAPALGLDAFSDSVPFAVTCAGYALLPDLDHPSSTVTRSLGPVTRALSAGLRRCSAALYARTKGPRDEACDGTHRHMSHTVLFAVLVGGLVAAGCWLVPWLALPAYALAGLLAHDRLSGRGVPRFPRRGRIERRIARWLRRAVTRSSTWMALVVLAGFGATVLLVARDPGVLSWRMGVAVAVGCVVHALGDALTEAGCPFLFPLYIRGETWFEIRPPRWLRFRAGGVVETRVVFPAMLVGAVAAVPGLWSTVGAVVAT